MDWNSKLDRDELKRRFFDSVGDLFPEGAPVHKLQEVSLGRGVWDEVKDQMMNEGITSTIKGWIRHTKDAQGRRVYHSLPARDAEGNEIPVYKPVALFDLNDYKIVLAEREKRIAEDVTVYLDLVAQAEERYGYTHKMPPEVRAYINAVTEAMTGTPLFKGINRAEKKRKRKPPKAQPKAET